MNTPNTWRPAGASDHPGWEVISRAILAIANRTARLSATYIEAEQEAVRAVNEWLEGQKITPEESGAVATLPSAGPNARLMPLLDLPPAEQFDIAWEPGRNSPRQNEARAYADRALTISALTPSPDAILPCDVHLPVNTYIRKGCTVEILMTAISKREGFPHDATVFAVPSPDGAGDVRELVDQVLYQFENDGRTLYPDNEVIIAIEKIRSAISPSPTGAAEPDDDWEARSERSYIDNAAAEPDAVRDLPLLWNGRANTLRILNGKRAQIDQATCGEADCYEQCAKELRELLSTPAVHDEQHTARFLTRLIYRHGVAYGKGLESEDAWVDANWRFFLGDARLLGGVASAARPSIEQLCVAIADGYNNGNQQYEECDAFARIRFHAAAESVAKLIPPAAGVTREAIARIVAPEAFAADYQHYFPDRSTLEQFEAYKKADAILTLPPVPDAMVSAEPAAWGRVIDGKAVTVSLECTPANDEPLYTSPQDVGREATVEALKPFSDIGLDVLKNRPGWANHVFSGTWCTYYDLKYTDFERAAAVYIALATNGGGSG